MGLPQLPIWEDGPQKTFAKGFDIDKGVLPQAKRACCAGLLKQPRAQSLVLGVKMG
jgi:hypothetical protein